MSNCVICFLVYFYLHTINDRCTDIIVATVIESTGYPVAMEYEALWHCGCIYHTKSNRVDSHEQYIMSKIEKKTKDAVFKTKMGSF